MTFTISNLLELVVALGLVNVWLLRSKLPTPFRGGESKNLRDEFRAYGLSDGAFWTVGALKLGCAGLLVAGLRFPELTIPAASVIAVLMVGALGMHLKARDPAVKFVPAFIMLVLSLSIIGLH